MQALVRAGTGYWVPPYGEPEWVEIPASEFWLGSNEITDDEQPLHRVYLDAFYISCLPITNAQYRIFVEATSHEPPEHWEEGRPPKGRESHPVVNVTWYDALAYCRWLSQVTGKQVRLPSEAEWEKAARGDRDQRTYPWGDAFDPTRCNSAELGLGGTTPAGIFPEGASPYGVLDMAGNVWEWTRSLYKEYPYDVRDGRENLEADGPRVLRGGAFSDDERYVRCAYRGRLSPRYRGGCIGFRLVASPVHL